MFDYQYSTVSPLRATGVYASDQVTSLPQRLDKRSMYDAVTDYFRLLDNYTADNIDEYMMEYRKMWENCEMCKDGGEFQSFIGHKKDSLIYKCEWSGEECSAANFTEVITDMGICYSFNTANNYTHDAALQVKYAGE